MTLEPIQQSVSVSKPPPVAFRVFTEQIGRWWPLPRFSVSQARAVGCVIQPHEGGEVYELRDDGVRIPWGRVIAWDPPSRLVLSWFPDRDPAVAQEVEVRFLPEGSGTRVELVHRGWERLGPDAQTVRDRYAGGWPAVLEAHFATWCRGLEGRRHDAELDGGGVARDG